jgi:hypothetical protein
LHAAIAPQPFDEAVNHKRSHLISLLMLLAGVVLLAFLVRQAGVAEIAARVKATGAGFLVLLAVSSVRVFARAWAWLRCMNEDERKVGFWPVWRARVVGDAAGQLTTAGPIIAEPMRVRALGGRLALRSRVSSLTVESLAYMISCCLLIVAGLLALLAAFALSGSLRAVSVVTVALTLFVIAFTVIVVRQRWHLASDVGAVAIRGLRFLGLGRKFDHRLHQLQVLEAHVFDFYAERPKDFLLVALSHAVFHLSGVAETYLTLYFAGFETSLLAAFTLEATNRVINIVFSFVPGRVGVDEASSGLLAGTLGIGATAGVALALIRKARVLVWTLLGVVFFAVDRWRNRTPAAQPESALRN